MHTLLRLFSKFSDGLAITNNSPIASKYEPHRKIPPPVPPKPGSRFVFINFKSVSSYKKNLSLLYTFLGVHYLGVEMMAVTKDLCVAFLGSCNIEYPKQFFEIFMNSEKHAYSIMNNNSEYQKH